MVLVMNRTTTKKTAPHQRSGTRRNQILNAALDCFLRRGVEATTIEQIREASGASHGSIYHHFGSKEAIALAVYSEAIQGYHALVLGRLHEQKTARDSVRAIVAAHLEWQQTDRDRSLYLTRAEISDASSTAASGIAEILQTFFRAVHDWLQPFIERGEIVRVPASLYVPLILGPAASFSRHWLSNRLDLDMTEVTELLAEAAWKSVAPA
jgi:AcrR family transcriptional regulator